MLKKYLAGAWLLLVLSTQAIAADTQKLGFIDTARVYQESRDAQAIQERLDAEFADRQAALQKLQQEGLALKKALESGKVASKDRDNEAVHLLEMDRQFRVQSAELLEEYNLRRNEEFTNLQQRANRVIVDYAHRQGYDLILQEAVFVDRKFDITDDIIRLLNGK